MRSCFLPFWPLVYYAHLQRKVNPRAEADDERGVKESDPMVAFSKELSDAEDDAEHMIVRSVQRWMPCLLTVLTATVSTPGSSSTSFYMALLVWLLRVTKSKTGIAVHILYPLIQFEFKWGTPEPKEEAKPQVKASQRSTKKQQSKDDCTPMESTDMSVNNTPKKEEEEESSPLDLTVEETKQLLPRFPAHYHQTYVEVIEKKEDELCAAQQEDPEKGFPHVVEKMKDSWEFNLVCLPLMILASFSARRSWLLSIIPVPIYFYRFKDSEHKPCDWRFIAFPLCDFKAYCRNQRVYFDSSILLILIWYNHVFDIVNKEDKNGRTRTSWAFNYCSFMILPIFMYNQSKTSVHVALLVLIHFFWSWKKDGSTSSFAILFFPILHFIYTSQTIYFMAVFILWLRIRPDVGSFQIMLLLLLWLSLDWGVKKGFSLVILPLLWLQHHSTSSSYADDPAPRDVKRTKRFMLFPFFFIESKSAIYDDSLIVSLLMLIWFRRTPDRRDYALIPVCYYNTDMCK